MRFATFVSRIRSAGGKQAGRQIQCLFPSAVAPELELRVPYYRRILAAKGRHFMRRESRSRIGQTSGEVAQHVDDGRFGLGSTKTQES